MNKSAIKEATITFVIDSVVSTEHEYIDFSHINKQQAAKKPNKKKLRVIGKNEST